MGWRDDIKAINAIIQAPGHARIGVLEFPGGRKSLIGIGVREAEQALESIEERFATVSEEARIAIAYVLDAPSFSSHTGAWAQAARDFYREDIAAVLVLEQSTYAHSIRGTSGAGMPASLLDVLPSSFWEGDLPVMFDESGNIGNYTEETELEHDETLLFVDITGFSRDDVASLGCWTRGIFPVFDATSTEYAQVLAFEQAKESLRRASGECFSDLVSICSPHGMPAPDGTNSLSIAETLEAALPGSVDLDPLRPLVKQSPRASKVRALRQAKYAIICRLEENDDYAAALESIKQMKTASAIIASSFKESSLLLDPQTSRLQDIADLLRPFLEILGATHKLEAVKSGIPVEDVVA